MSCCRRHTWCRSSHGRLISILARFFYFPFALNLVKSMIVQGAIIFLDQERFLGGNQHHTVNERGNEF